MSDHLSQIDIDRTGRCAYQLEAGVFLLGGLVADEHARFAAHLGECDRCNADIAELLPVLALLDSSRIASTQRAEDAPSTGLRQHVVAAVGRAGSDAVLASVRELRPGSSEVSAAGSSVPGVLSAARSTGAANTATPEMQSAELQSAGSQSAGAGLGTQIARPKRFDRRIFAVAAAALLAIGITVASVRKTGTPGTSYQLVALQKDPLKASAKISTKSDTTVAEFVVNGTVRDEVYFAWFEDPAGKRIGLGSFRGADGPVRFRGQTGVLRSTIVAVGASTRVGDKPTDRIRAELPKA